MKKITCSLAFLLITLFAQAQEPAGAKQFWENLKKHCGKTYGGAVTEGLTDDFKQGPLLMQVKACEDGTIRIPFTVGEDRSRTWVLTYQNDRIMLKHDHRHQDGTEDKITQYGGLASNSGQATLQIFPADQQTVNLLPQASGNVWWITLTEDSFSYNLRRIGTDRIFTVKFDLSKALTAPASPWGWKD